MPDRAGPRWRARRAFTLVEVVLALALILAIGSLVLPSLDSSRAQWLEAQRSVSMAAIEARAISMHDARPVRLVAHTADSLTQLLAAHIPPPADPTDGPPGADQPLVPAGEVIGALPGSVTLVPLAPDASSPDSIPADQPNTSSAPRSAASSGPDLSPAPPVADVVLLTMLPSGQVTLAPGWALKYASGSATPSVNTWTGEVTFTLVEAPDATGQANPPADAPTTTSAGSPSAP